MQRLRTSGSSIIGQLALPQLKRKALNSWSAVQDTYYSTKDIFEGHKVVFTIATSLASIATAWGGYTLRHLHESKVEQRLDSIEKAVSIYAILYTHIIHVCVVYTYFDKKESKGVPRVCNSNRSRLNNDTKRMKTKL
ncbi:hypothetical protein CsSME_00026951 [Camellia sinensis var. sinensis]